MSGSAEGNYPLMGAKATLADRARLISLLLVFALLVPLHPADADEGPALIAPPRAASDLPPSFERTLRTMASLGVPEPFLEGIRARAFAPDAEVDTATDVFAYGVPDLNGDGMAEVIEWQTTYSLYVDLGDQTDPFGAGEEAKTVFTIRAGDSGKKLWRKRYDDLVFPVVTTAGDGKRGIVVIGGLFTFFSTSGERRLDLESLRGKNGKRLWARSFTSIEAGDYFNHVSTDAPVSLGFGQVLPGKPSDIVITLATEVSALLTTTTLARVVVVDGGDGSVVSHPRVDVGIDWQIYADVVGDLDGDGLQDYAVVNNPGIDPGGPQEPVTVGGTIYARRGTDGSDVWTTSGLELHDFAWAVRLPDVVAGGAPEVGLMSPNDPNWKDFANYLFDGSTGAEHWKKLGFGMMVPGDIDGTGQPDIFIGDGRISIKNHRGVFIGSAYRGSGQRIYRKVHRWNFEGLPCPQGACSGGWGFGFGGAGDVHPDRIRDVYFYLYAQQDPGPAQEYVAVADGRNGKRVTTLDERTYPAGVTVDGRGDDLFRIATKEGISTIEVLDGLTQKQRLRTVIQRSKGVLPPSADAWADGFNLPGDRCSDLVVNMWSRDGSYYAVLDGGSAKVLWSSWNGSPNARPRFTTREDSNRAC